ncbi:MAG: MBL fold metallo-hydrolase [Bryobacteraceae bacterium]
MTPNLEIGGNSREVLPGVHLIRLPLPFSLGIVNVYLVRLAEGYLLIDCGMNTESCFAALAASLGELGIRWTDVRRILVTHMHPDHIGLAHRLLGLTGASLSMHAEEVKELGRAVAGSYRPGGQIDILTRAGVPPDQVAEIDASFDEIAGKFQPLVPETILNGGEKIPSAIGELEVIWTPGHSPGHVCLYCPGKLVLFAGDQILEGVTPNIGWQPDHDALGEFLVSLERLASLEVSLVLPAHGAPFATCRTSVEIMRKHHARRCRLIETALAEGSKTAHELAATLWKRKLSPFHHRFAVYEVLAHLENLRRRERVVSGPHQGVERWSPALKFKPCG